MDINASNFWQQLPVVLEAIADAHFVSIDLEMSGVRVKEKEKKGPPPELTMTRIYRQARHAARTFEIIQVGLTCIRHEDCGRASLFCPPLLLFRSSVQRG